MTEVMQQQAIFRSVGQALHVSFLMEILPATVKGPTQVVIEGLLKGSGVWDEMPREDRRVHFGGLSPLELRGQCAMVRATVDDHLPGPERDAVKARFGWQVTKAAGVRGLASYVADLCSSGNSDAVLALTWSVHEPRTTRRDREQGRQQDWSLRKIAEDYGVSKSTLGRDRQIVIQQSVALERCAQGRLQEFFERTGLVDSD